MRFDERSIHRLYSVLSAAERAKLVLKSIKEATEEDPTWRATLPLEQAAEFNRLIRMINGVNGGAGVWLAFLTQRADSLSSKVAFAATLRHQEVVSEWMDTFLEENLLEAITKSEYAKLQKASTTEYLTPEQLAEIEVAAEYPRPPREIREEWKQFKLGEIRRAIDDGVLTVRRTKEGEKINGKAYAAWRGKSRPVLSPRGGPFLILPDSKAADVEIRNQECDAIRDGLAELKPKNEQLKNKVVAETAYLAQNVLAIDKVIAEVATEFDGEDPCRPVVRELLERLREVVADIRKRVDLIAGPLEQKEDLELQRKMREMVLTSVYAEPEPEPSLLDRFLEVLAKKTEDLRSQPPAR